MKRYSPGLPFCICAGIVLTGPFIAPHPIAGADTHAASKNLARNGGFEDGLKGWSQFWTRDRAAGRARLDSVTRHSGRHSVRLVHTGRRDWSFSPNLKLAVRPGELIELSAWVKVDGSGEVALGAITYDRSGRVRDWNYGGRTVRGSCDWHHLRSRMVIPDEVAHIAPRLIGDGPATVWLDDFVVVRAGHLDDLRQPDLPAAVSVRSQALVFTLRTKDGTFHVRDMRNGREWTQRPLV
ncbi:MAG TPA: hypothetical protein EYP14_20745, partial [Planctomycetaceae bacterium]|nr:hypothetical protein [Planctomycetaceae bacterium]